jgi:endonuclease/exonuclease/phosphatase family metal-dependent hydrolase
MIEVIGGDAARTHSVAPDRPVRVASYNIHRCIGRDGRCDPERVAGVLREIDCDVVGLQEVDNSPGPGPTSMQLEYLAACTGMNAVAGLRIVRNMGHYGNALLTRHRILRVRRHDLSVSSWLEPRGAVDAEVEIEGIACRILVTHLGLMPGERQQQTRTMLALVGETPFDQPLALLGDINEWLPIGRSLRALHALFGRPPYERSFPAFFPLFALDRIWARPRESLRTVRAHRSGLARAASDHLPVVGEWSVAGIVAPAHGVQAKEKTGGVESDSERLGSSSDVNSPVLSNMSTPSGGDG